MNMREQVEETLKEENPHALFLDGFDAAIIGIARRASFAVVAYNESACIDIVMKDQEMTEDDAWEYFLLNVQKAGEHTPVLISYVRWHQE
jgi:hypothetical protein